jgi:hypothetical protein
MSELDNSLSELSSQREDLELFQYPSNDCYENYKQYTWKVPFIYEGKEHLLEVESRKGKFGLNWCLCDKIIENIIGTSLRDAARRDIWRNDRKKKLFAKYPNIPMLEWYKTPQTKMSQEWSDFWDIYQEHMYKGEYVKKHEPKYRDFWNIVLDDVYDNTRSLRRDDFNDFPWEFYNENHRIWQDLECYKVIISLHQKMTLAASAYFPEIQVRSKGKQAIRYWIFW